MQYDPVKRTLGKIFNQNIFLRKAFYRLLDLLLLRAWHIHRELRYIPDSSAKGNGIAILDAGAGFGQYSFWMHHHFINCNILAVDVKEEQVEDCNNFFKLCGADNVRFEMADLTKFKNENNFDLVLCVDVMEHIEQDILVLKNFCSSLKPGGMLLISTPSDQGGSDAQEDSDESFIEEHVRNGYNINDMKNKLREAGFLKSEIKYSYGSPGKISWKLSMKFPIQLAGVSKIFLLLLPFYYLIVYPFAFVLNFLDVRMTHSTGTGLIVKAWK
ncbi:MAG: class I SAM-dependent methyltransferase [Bacteroidia bacterium]|nr:class I SAM-dependent methyltransferase [Bacteroidia bacterium]